MTLRLEAALLARLKRLAAEQDRTVSQEARRAIRAHVDREGRR